MQFFLTAEDYVSRTGNAYNYIYNYTDHLGNVRVSYTKDPVSGLTKIVEESNYYPFGMKHANYNDYAPPAPGVANKGYQYKYNGQELQTELGLNMTAMDYRQYDNAIGRFNSMDVLSVLGMSMTPYQFGNNNPVSFSDPTGLIAGGNPFMNGLWNNSPDNKNTIWTNNGYGSFVNQSYTGMVDIQDGMYTDLTEVVNLPEISVSIRPGGGAAGIAIQNHVYNNSPFYDKYTLFGLIKNPDVYDPMGNYIAKRDNPNYNPGETKWDRIFRLMNSSHIEQMADFGSGGHNMLGDMVELFKL
ncbi:RHS repeat domain-containing protein [Flavobacterium kingsejongi]|uniref:RHS repeat-associated core domain-containing protein n=1 Tax=Flavobacterium kingsejongi TaxID=1678728 RepID=A0A2S1LRH5_9FLAO|nr:RHS repeat-associated core domain-containing protein [Flavobacterium kingsejongi]AWG26261.1 hypothetical protein FK004_13990 [Flavobacterium kingsejongi]